MKIYGLDLVFNVVSCILVFNIKSLVKLELVIFWIWLIMVSGFKILICFENFNFF